jgi:chromate transporter
VTLHAAVRPSLRELALYFLRLGLTAFGGPAVHIALMEEHCVRKRSWLSHEEFLDLLGASNLLPGPTSTQLAMMLGQRLWGWRGLLIAGACFILPAALVTLALAWAYGVWGSLPQLQHIFLGLKPVIVAIILHAVLSLGRKALKTWDLALIAIAALVAAWMGAGVMFVLLGAGLVHVLWRLPQHAQVDGAALAVLPVNAVPQAMPVLLLPVTLDGLFWIFFRTGALIFGGGTLLFSFLHDDLVLRLHWLTQAQLLDAIAVGQLTPGPVFTTATFVGYQLAGVAGAVAATVGIFLPAFVSVALAGHWVPWLRRSAQASAFLDGVIAAALACMLWVGLTLGFDAVTSLWSVGLAVAALLALQARVPALALLGVGAIMGLLLV